MQTPLQLTFRKLPHSDALAAHAAARTAKLEHVCDRIVSCHVVFELSGHHHQHGDRYRVAINLGLPGHEIVVSHAPANDRAPETAYASADRAFDEAERQLEDWSRTRRGARHAREREA